MWDLNYVCESVSFHRNADTAIGGMVWFASHDKGETGTKRLGYSRSRFQSTFGMIEQKEFAQQDSLSLESLIFAADTSSCVPARGGDIKFQLTPDNLLPDWVQENSFLCGCQRSTSTRAHTLGCRSTCWASDLFAHYWVNNLSFPNCQELGSPPHHQPGKDQLSSAAQATDAGKWVLSRDVTLVTLSGWWIAGKMRGTSDKRSIGKQ